MTAAASIAIDRLLTGPEVGATLVGDYPVATYLGTDRGIVALVTPEAIRLPNALVLNPADHAIVVRHADSLAGSLAIGGGRVRVGPVEVRVGRWWDPVPRLGPAELAVVEAALAEIEPVLPPWPVPGEPATARLAMGREVLIGALAGAADGEQAASVLVGLGAGLTPAGDDLFAGAIAATAIFGRALGADHVLSTVAMLAEAATLHESRTTALAADLTRHAAAGAVTEPVADLCRAIVEGRSTRPALQRLLAIGHTSGRDLAEGVVIAARTLAHRLE